MYMNSNKERNANGSYTGAVFSSVRTLHKCAFRLIFSFLGPHRKDGVGSLGLQAAATNLKKANSCILRCVQIELMIKMIANCRLNYLYAFAFTALRITLAIAS